MALSLSGPEWTARCCSPEPRSERQALTVLSSPCSRSVRNPQTPGSAMPSPRPAACLTSCCTRTCARPQGRPCLGAGPLPPPIPWAPFRWAAIRPEVGQVWWWCRQHLNPMAWACFRRWVSGLFGQWSLGIPAFPAPQATGLCVLRAQDSVQTRTPQASSWRSKWLPRAHSSGDRQARAPSSYPHPAGQHSLHPFAMDIAVIAGLHPAGPFRPSWTIPRALWACQEGR